MTSLALPRPEALAVAPERAALVLLDAALAVARAALLAHNPDVVLLGGPKYGRDPPPTTVLAARLVGRADALHLLLAQYLAALEDLDRHTDGLPF